MKEKQRFQVKKLTPAQIQTIEDQVAEQAEVIVSANYFVVEISLALENGRWHLRVYIDHPNAAVRVTLEDCKDISGALQGMIDDNVAELKDFPYVLEVSSPGLFRTLGTPRELAFYRARRIEIKPKNGEAFIAYLQDFDRTTQEVVYRLSADDSAETHRLAWTPKTVQVSLSPDLTQPMETKTVPRRINRDD